MNEHDVYVLLYNYNRGQKMTVEQAEQLVEHLHSLNLMQADFKIVEQQLLEYLVLDLKKKKEAHD